MKKKKKKKKEKEREKPYKYMGLIMIRMYQKLVFNNINL